MHFDLLTLYVLAIGTLLVSAGMTAWERQALPARRGALGLLSLGYVTLAVGCAAATARSMTAGVMISALSNLVIVGGYLLILNGVARLAGRSHRMKSGALLVLLAGAWAIVGVDGREAMWSYGSALPIALVSALTSWEALRSETFRPLRGRRIVAIVTGVHAVLYLGRALVLPGAAMWYGPEVLSIAGKITLYDGVLYSVCLPMALLALVREEAHRQILEVSRTDYLTGLGTRRWFFEQAAQALGGRTHPQATLLVFDLDHFKAVNDRYGHAAGDAVLRVFGQILRNTLAPRAIAARMGGEEFVALLPSVDARHGCEIGEIVARRLAETIIAGDDGAVVSATVSVGVAEYGIGTSNLADLLAAADRALYLAKALGRNRVETAQPLELAAVA
jgi:diguanylate cyclase (GGDEF)-like protein